MRVASVLLLAGLVLRSQPAPAFGSRTEIEQMHCAFGVVIPGGSSRDALDAGTTFSFGGIYWVGPQVGLHSELSYTRVDPAGTNGPAAEAGQISGLTAGVAWKLHRNSTGLYLAVSGGAHNVRRTVVSGPAGSSTTVVYAATRGGVTGILGFEVPMEKDTTFFIEARWQRIFTQNQPMDLIPLVIGARF